MSRIILINLSLLSLMFFSCENVKNSNKEISGESVSITNWPSGKKKSEIHFLDEKRNGWSFSYDKRGNIYQKVHYKNDMKNGEAFIYHSNGKVRQHSNYFNDKLNGKRIKHFSNGKVSSELTYVNDTPCSDLVEYLKDGSIKKTNPDLVFKEINNILLNETFILKVSVSGEYRKVIFYKSNNTIKDCEDLSTLLEYPKKGENHINILYPVPEGTFRMEEVYIVAQVTTRQGNPLILQKKYNLAIENRE